MGVYLSRIFIWVAFAAVVTVSQAACLKIYRQELRQGNYVTQAKIDKLQIGMSKDQVQQIMGSPALIPAVDLTRWDYYYSYLSGDRTVSEQKSFSLYFVKDQLKYFAGDWSPAHLPRKPE